MDRGPNSTLGNIHLQFYSYLRHPWVFVNPDTSLTIPWAIAFIILGRRRVQIIIQELVTVYSSVIKASITANKASILGIE